MAWKRPDSPCVSVLPFGQSKTAATEKFGDAFVEMCVQNKLGADQYGVLKSDNNTNSEPAKQMTFSIFILSHL